MNKYLYGIVLVSLLSLTIPVWAPNGQQPVQKQPEPTKTYLTKPEKQPQHIPSFVPRSLLIFLDDSETYETAVIGLDLATAINQEAGPILASASLIIKNIDRFVNLDKWILKKVNQYLYLLLPLSYFNKNVTTSNPVTTELELGLKINHMELIDYKELDKDLLTKELPPYATYFMDALYNTTTKTSSIFCLRSEYYEHKVFTQPLWSICIDGHGAMGWLIVNLPLESFKSVLDFLATKLNTRLLVYLSCYAAGYNTEKIYKESGSLLQKTYPFTIITQALGDAAATTVSTALKYNLFVQHITTPVTEIINYEKAMDALNAKDALNQKSQEYYKKYNLTPQQNLSWSNVPQIKMPGLPYFTPMTNRKNAVAIGAILAKSRSADSPLDIAQYFKVDPKALLLYAADIPFELILNPSLDAIISMIPGDAVHTFWKLSSATKTLDEVADLFFKLELLEPLKLFFMNQVTALDQKTHKTKTYNNVIFYNKHRSDLEEYHQYAFYKHTGKIYVKDMSFQSGPNPSIEEETQGGLDDITTNPSFEEANQEDTQFYYELWDWAHEKVVKLGSYIFTSISDTAKFPFLTGTTTAIESIMATKDFDLNYMIEFLKKRTDTPSKSIAWVYKLTGYYTPSNTFTIPGATNNEILTLFNVIIDNRYEKPTLYYSYNGKGYRNGKEIDDNYTSYYRPIQHEGSLLPSQVTAEGIDKIKKVTDTKTKHLKEKK